MKLGVTGLGLFLLIASLGGCVTAEGTKQAPPLPPTAAAPATETDGIRVRSIDPDAQKGLVDRMKACCEQPK